MGLTLQRAIDATLLTALSAPVIYPTALVFVDWPSDPVYVHSGTGDLTWDSLTWTGVGDLGGMTIPDEASGLVPESAELMLMAPLQQALADAANQSARNAAVDMWIGATTTPGGTTLVGTPCRMFTGYIDGSPDPNAFELDASGRYAFLRVTVRAGQPARAAASIAHSDEDQQARFAGDTLFRRVANAAKWRSLPPQWPAA